MDVKIALRDRCRAQVTLLVPRRLQAEAFDMLEATQEPLTRIHAAKGWPFTKQILRAEIRKWLKLRKKLGRLPPEALSGPELAPEEDPWL